MKTLQKFSLLILVSIFLYSSAFSQGVIISGSSGDTPASSAIFEVKSTTQGLLIPRMLTSQRELISNPVSGLLVFDTNLNSFFIYGDGKWVDLSMSSEIWTQNATNVYLTNSAQNVGIGTKTPSSKFVIQADKSKAEDDILFEVKDKTGKTIMSVTSVGVRMYVANPAKSGKGISGGFAVGKYGAAKGVGDLLVVNSGATNIYVDDAAAKGISGGFAVGKYGAAKEKGLGDLLIVTGDSTRVYTDESLGISGGFAVGKYGAAKDKKFKYFYTHPDSTRIYSNPSAKGISGGFAVGKYGAAKATFDKFVQFTNNNAFIGLSAGSETTTGTENVFIGKNAGIQNTIGSNNVYIGNLAGSNSGATLSTGNIFIGNSAGSGEIGSNKLYISNNSSNSAGALIYGDFTTGSERVNLNGTLRFNRGFQTITMPTTRGTANYVLTTNGAGSTNWINVNSLVSFPPSNDPNLVITELLDFPIEDPTLTTLVVRSTDVGSPSRVWLPDVNEIPSRIIIIKNSMVAGELRQISVESIAGDLIDGQVTPLIINFGESYTLQSSIKDVTWYIIGKSMP
ncbi:MAG: hypothetical protein L3J35_04485 [Bacteroidales bacterium]|nr:hypothetical protein [Bacteroidales bacterium]